MQHVRVGFDFASGGREIGDGGLDDDDLGGADGAPFDERLMRWIE